MCQHSYEYKGHRSYGDTIPGRAQGVYFPGDEPGTRCRLTGEACGNLRGDTPTECPANSPTEWLCPVCQIECGDVAIWKSDETGTYFCCECENKWTEAELSRAFASLLTYLTQEQAKLDEARKQAQAKTGHLYEVIGKVREVLGVAI